MTNNESKRLCLDLLKADSEQEVIEILKKENLWQDRRLWRLYGDKEGNFAQAGNQQALPEAALVEKIVNSCDARLMVECLRKNIAPESDEAPKSVRDAVAMFFEGRRSEDDEAGSLARWPKARRTEQSRFITIAATGGRPTRGHKSKRMCLTITDQAEGQSPARLPKTILSLNEKNKQRIRFVQGKFNMGGSGVLRFCGGSGIELIVSRRCPDLAKKERERDSTVEQWGFTVVRREEPSNISGDPIHSEFTYLAPENAEQSPRGGEVLRFSAETLPLMPEHDEAYKQEIAFGTAIKLYEYETTVGQSNVLMKDGLMYALERLLPEIALPVRMHECRGYEGEKERSFETPIAGLVVRLEDGKGDNLEENFPLSSQLRASGMNMTARIYAFKEDKAATYLKDEGVIFTINGQAHGYLPKSIFSRKAVGLPRLKDSLLVLVDCSTLLATQREDLFMSSRDRLSKKPIRFAVEEEIEEMLHSNPELRKLQQERRERDVATKLSEEKPLEEVLGRILTSSPALKNLFLKGQRLPRPFAGGRSGGGTGNGSSDGQEPFRGKPHPTYFRIPDSSPGEVFSKNSELRRRCRVKFETDVENGYFDRATDQGSFELEVIEGTRPIEAPNYSLTLEDGEAFLSLALPEDVQPQDSYVIQSTVNDPTLPDPFVSLIRINVVPRQERSSGQPSSKKPKHSGGNGDGDSQAGISFPPIVLVYENDEHWVKYSFTPMTACHVISDPIEEGDETKYLHCDAPGFSDTGGGVVYAADAGACSASN